MPISLPDSPTDGQTVQLGTIVYTYDATAGVWNSASATGPTLTPSTVHTSDTAPSNPNDGDMWFDSSIGKTFIWYNDGTSSQWIQMNPNTGGAGGGANLGSVSESIIPDTDITYDLGSSSKKFKDLYLSGNTLNLGNQSISATSTGIVVPEIQIGSGTNNVKLSTNASGNLITTETDSSGNSGGASPAGGAATIVADMAGLIALTGMSAGSQAYVTANNKLYFYTGSGWYLIATVQNDAPSAITGVDGSYSLAIDGTATTITAVSTDPEGFSLTWAYTASGLGSIATVSQADNVFTVTPSTDAANAGSFTLTISATDGINGAVSTIPSFSLQFSVTNSRYTTLSVKATATGSNQTFDDASTLNHTITTIGDTTASTFSPHRHGGYSAYFDNPTVWSYLRLPDTTLDNIVNDSTASAIATHTTTIEAWVYQLSRRDNFASTNGSGSCIFVKGYTWFNLGIDVDGYVQCYHMSGGSALQSGAGYTENNIITSNTVPLNAWSHVAAVIDNSQIKVYVNGVLGATGTWGGLHDVVGSASRESSIGAGAISNNAPRRFDGYIRNFRISDNSRYASNFTPSTELPSVDSDTDFLLGGLPYFKDQSTSNHAITVVGNTSLKPFSLFDNAPYSEADHGASAYFDGSGDWLYTVNQNIPTGSYQVDGWFYAKDTNNVCIFSQGTSGNSNRTGLWINGVDNGYISFYVGTNGSGGTGNNDASSWGNTTIPSNQWTHFATTYNGSQMELFINGISLGTASNTNDAESNTPFYIGAFVYNSAPAFNGYMSDIRISDTVRNTSNFTPPTSPYSADSNTKFLLNPETSISDLSQSSAITCVGNAATDTTQVKFAGTKSIAFDGTGDYLTFDIPGGDIGANEDFTVELWHRCSSNQWCGIFQVASQILGNAGGSGIPTFAISRRTSSGRYQIYYGGSGGNISAGAGQTTVGQWYHLAYVRYNGTVKIYEDGTEITALSAADTAVYTTPKGVIGGKWSTSYLMFGNIQDFRFTRGLARYTANFTPPTAELQG